MRSSDRRSLTAHPAQLEYLGHVATVVASGHPPLVGLAGVVVDETKNTFVLETATGVVTVAKAGQTFRIRGAEVDGRAIGHRPEDRIKKARVR